MGVEKYLLASALKGVLAQRLVRKLCGSCAEEVPDPDAVMRMLSATGFDTMAALGGQAPRLRRAKGCPACRQSGFSGRTTIYELLTTTTRVRDVMLTTSSESVMERAGIADGMTTMLQNGLSKALKGETTPEEVLRVTRFDGCLDTDTRPTTRTEH